MLSTRNRAHQIATTRSCWKATRLASSTLRPPIRFIPQHQISDLMHPVMSGNAKTGPLSNGDLYYKATQRTMAEAGLIAHRALPDAKAERDWMTKLQSMKDAMFGEKPRFECAVSMRAFRKYHEQYQIHRQYKAQKLAHI